MFNAENNIELGVAYLSVLAFNELDEVDDPVSREYCVISAYNTGPGNVAKAFTNGRNIVEAAKLINKMSPKDVYSTLVKKLPYDETKEYLKKVSERVVAYKK